MQIKLPKKYKGYKVSTDNKMKYYGETDDTKKTIKINVRKSLKAGGVSELKDTIRHEKYHAAHPEATEKETEKNIKHKTQSQTEMVDLAIKGMV